jgi:biotin synthase
LNPRFLADYARKVLSGEALTKKEARRIAHLEKAEDIRQLLFWADQVRDQYKGNTVDLCAIINAKSGRCSEDCTFCAQSSHYSAGIKKYPLLGESDLLEAASRARSLGAGRFSLVTSGRSLLSLKELDRICRVISGLAKEKISPCASLGLLTPDLARVLKKAGLVRYHHNLETGPRHYPSICTTHSFSDRLATLRIAREAGFSLCSGGIFGLGETLDDRVEMAFILKKMKVDSVPLNFLNPIPGTPLASQPPLSPLEILKSIALFRLILPEADIRSCGGREKGLRTLQPMMYLAGCNGTMIGNYLTTEGRNPEADIQEIFDLGLRPRVQREDGRREMEDGKKKMRARLTYSLTQILR